MKVCSVQELRAPRNSCETESNGYDPRPLEFSLNEDSDGWVAQLVEHRTENPGVAGSIPAPAICLITTYSDLFRLSLGKCALFVPYSDFRSRFRRFRASFRCLPRDQRKLFCRPIFLQHRVQLSGRFLLH